MMVKVDVSVIIEPTDEWLQQFTAYFKELQKVEKNANSFLQPDESCEELDKLQRDFGMKTINHISQL